MMPRSWVIAFFSLLIVHGGAAAVHLHVDPAAEAAGDGSPDRPLRTIAEARDAARRLRQRDARLQDGVFIELRSGDYLFSESIAFDGRDSGRPGAPVVIRAAEGHRPRLIGGVVLDRALLKPVGDASVLERLPTAAARREVLQLTLGALLPAAGALAGPAHRGMGAAVVPIATEVFLDGRALTRSRWPNGGFARVDAVVDPGSVPRNRAEDIPPGQRETGPPRGGVIRLDDDRVDRWTGAGDAWLFGYWHHDWADEQLPIQQIDGATGQITLGLPHRYGLKAGASFYITNLLEELDEPGEYYIDVARGILYLWPPAGAVGDRLTISTLAEPVFRLDGARHVEIVGLTIECTRGPAIVAEDAEGLLIAGCTIQNTGTHGIVVRGRNNTIRGNDLIGIGATGIDIGGGDRATLTAADNLVVNNHVRDFGRVYRTYQPAIGVSGVGQRIANNLLHDAPHSAIIFGGNDHRFERNEIFDVLKETGDCGAIYCGRDWTLHGNIIRHNLFHHLRGTPGRWQNAVYLDDMASGIEVIGNVFFDCHWGMLVGGGRHVQIRGNVFVKGEQAIRFDARGVGWMARHIADPATSTLHRNLGRVPYDRPPWSERFPELAAYLTDGFGRPIGSAVIGNAVFASRLGTIDDREAVRVEGNVVETGGCPLVRKAGGGSMGVVFTTPVLQMDAIGGFEPIPVGQIGLMEDAYRRPGPPGTSGRGP